MISPRLDIRRLQPSWRSEPTGTARALSPAGWSLSWQAALFSRLFIWVVAMVALGVVALNKANVLGLDPHMLTDPFKSSYLDRIFAPAGRWDSAWYMEISTKGYFSVQSENFFPLYPLLVHVATWVFRIPLLAGLFVSVVLMLAALWLLHDLAVLDVGEDGARIAVTLMAVFPMSLFLSAVYTESLFLFLTIAAIYAARKDRWLLAGVCGLLATATRSNGLLLLAPLAVMFFYGPRELAPDRAETRWWVPRYNLRPQVLWLALVPAGLGLFMLYLQLKNGTPMEPFKAQEQFWGHHFAGPFGGVVDAIKVLPHDISAVWNHTNEHLVDASDPISWNGHELIDFAFVLVSAAALIVTVRRVPVAYTVYTVLAAAFFTSVPTVFENLQSYDRYSMALFPLFIGVGGWLANKPRTRIAVYVICAGLLGVFSWLWATWAWVA